MSLVHATCVAISGTGILIRGPSGAGKSDLALRLIDAGAELVADDYCEITARDGELTAAAPASIAGKIEVRGFGLIDLPFRSTVRIGLVVDLVPEADIERLPDANVCAIDGVSIPRLLLNAFAASATAKVRLIIGRKT